MKILLVVMMIFGVWVLPMFGSAKEPAPITVKFDAASTNITKYSIFVDSLRDAVKDATLQCYGIPMLPSSSVTPNFTKAELEANAKTITLLYRRTNLYIIGYSDLVNTKCRYHIFNDITGTILTDAQDTLCPNKNNRQAKNINYASSYSAIEGKAGKHRSLVDIGITVLASSIGKISGVATFSEQTEAIFLLAAIQMTAEAARFKYIENRFRTHLANVRPDHNMIRLQETWGKISTEIHKAENGMISPPLSLNRTGDVAWIVVRVDQIKPYISLLNHISGTCQANAMLIAAA